MFSKVTIQLIARDGSVAHSATKNAIIDVANIHDFEGKRTPAIIFKFEKPLRLKCKRNEMPDEIQIAMVVDGIHINISKFGSRINKISAFNKTGNIEYKTTKEGIDIYTFRRLDVMKNCDYMADLHHEITKKFLSTSPKHVTYYE